MAISLPVAGAGCRGRRISPVLRSLWRAWRPIQPGTSRPLLFDWLQRPADDQPPAWRRNPFTGVEVGDPQLSWWRIPDFDPQAGDIKAVCYAKERVEVYSEGRVAVIDNFRKTEAFGFSGFTGLKTKIDKGHAAQFQLLTERWRTGGEPLIPFAELENATLASLACVESLQRKAWVSV